MNTVLITGATSMIGAALAAECLAHGCRVVAVSRKGSARLACLPHDKNLRLVEADLADLKTLDAAVIGPCEVFFHLAWANTDKAGRADPARQQANVAYTLDALDLAARLGCQKFIGAGSQAEYGVHRQCPTGPDSPADPQVAYGVCKYAAGKLGALRARQLGLDFIWVRIFSVYGPNDLPGTMISTTVDRLRRGEHCAFTAGTHLWDYLYSADAARAFRLIGEKVRGEKVYCLGSGTARPLREYIMQLRDIAAPGMELGLGEIPYPDGKGMDLCADITALTADTGWTAQTDFAAGVHAILDRLPASAR